MGEKSSHVGNLSSHDHSIPPGVAANVGKLERRSLLGPVQIEERDGGPAHLTGHSAVFNSKSEDLGFFIEIIRSGAFVDALRNFEVVCLANHNVDRLIAATRNGTLLLNEDQRGLYMDATPMDTQVCRDVVTEVRSLAMNGQSFSFDVETDNWRMENGVQLREIIKVSRVYDVGPVVFPAYPATDVSARDLMATAGIDIEGFSQALVKQFRGLPLEVADRDVVKQAMSVLQLAIADDRQEPDSDSAAAQSPEAWRYDLLRRRLDLAAMSA